MQDRVITIHADAPPKPAFGAPCNGCGVCCLAEPCPAGMLLTRRRSGPCTLLTWHAAERHYRCGLLARSGRPGLRGTWEGWRQRLARRWIAAGIGCDAALDIAPSPRPAGTDRSA